MKVVVVQKVTVNTPEGMRTLTPGQTLNVTKERAIELITLGKVRPVEPVIYKGWSDLLQEHILIVETERDKANVPNPEDPVVDGPNEIRALGKLKGKREDIRVRQEAKKTLKGDILRVEPKKKGGRDEL